MNMLSNISKEISKHEYKKKRQNNLTIMKLHNLYTSIILLNQIISFLE